MRREKKRKVRTRKEEQRYSDFESSIPFIGKEQGSLVSPD